MEPVVVGNGARRALARSEKASALIKTITVQDQTNPRRPPADRPATLPLSPPIRPWEAIRLWVNWITAAFVATALVWPHAMMAAGVTMMSFGLWCFVSRTWQWTAEDNPAALINLNFAIFAIGSTAISWSNGDTPAQLEQYLPFLGAGLLAVGLRVASPPPFQIGAAFALAALLGAAASIAQVATAGEMHRASLLSYSTRFGTMGALCAVICTGFLSWPRATDGRTRRILLATGAVGGVLVALLSGSKGSWLVLALVLPPALLLLTRNQPGKPSLAWLLALPVVLTAAALLPNSPVIPRIKEAFREGDRLRTAYIVEAAHMFAANPWFGSGRELLRSRLGEVSLTVRKGTPLDEPPNDAHNEFLDILATRGAAGLALLLLCYAVPAGVFIRRLRTDPNSRGPAAAGLLFMGAFTIAGLTDVQFAVNEHRMVFLFVILYCVTEATRRTSSRPPL